MKVSVVTVCYNAASTIGYTIKSFLRQSHADKEMVIVDGQSEDRTLDVIRNLASEHITLISGPDVGIYDAANKGLARFGGDAVGFLNADDRFHDEHVLAEIAGGLETAEIVFGGVDFVDDHENGRVVRRWRGSPFEKGSFAHGWMPAHPSFYVRRQVTEAVGPFDLSYRIAADYDWMLRACELHDFSTRLLDRTLVDMAIGGVSTISLFSHIKHNLEALRSRRHWLGSGVVDAALITKPLRKLGQLVARQRR